MSLTDEQLSEITKQANLFLEKRRPPIEVREQLDLAYRIEGQSIIVFEIRPFWLDKDKIVNEEIAKATFVKADNVWKIFWLNSGMKWNSYSPKPTVKSIKHFFDEVDQDRNSCFFG